MTNTEITFLLWGCGGLLAILGFIGALAVNALIKMGNDIHDIKIALAHNTEKHEALRDRVIVLEEKVLA